MIKGSVLMPDDPGYEEARQIWNAMIDRRPAIIVQCADADDVPTAIAFARRNKLEISIRGAGHNIAGNALCNDGLTIDFSNMKNVRVDAGKRRAYVEPGATLANLDEATQTHGLAIPVGINSTTGIAGLTLGGGFGWLTRKYGMTIDNLVSVDVITAEGRKIRASETDNADLFWAIRGGGGNFGVVTSFLFQAHPVKMVYAGPIFWDAVHATRVMRTYRDFLPTAAEDLGIFVGLKTVPSMDPFPKEGWGKRACVIIGSYNGEAADGPRALAPLLEALPSPIFNWMGEMPFPAINALFDPFFPKGLQWYWKGDFVQSLTDEAIETHITEAAKAPTELCLMHLYPIDGAVRRVPPDATPWAARNASFSMVIAGISPDPQHADALKSWGRTYWKAVHPYNMGGGYVNFMFDDEADGRVQAAYGDNYARLAVAKTKYDPANLFCVNQNIAPAAAV
jgi:hypothetical protein